MPEDVRRATDDELAALLAELASQPRTDARVACYDAAFHELTYRVAVRHRDGVPLLTSWRPENAAW